MSPQSLIAHYRIVAKLGEGGMGEVWRGTDTRLNRDVAIKILPKAFAHDADRLARFTREAQVLASLNHPNIAAIYGVEEGSLVMELVEGPTLADRIAAGPLPLDDALPIVHQLVDALEYAHEKGVMHRDLKPANIKVTPEGKVKVLDFGLAKALTPDMAAADPVSSPTLTMGATVTGAILGTAAYMSPEQARGQNVDKRADIWAFGVIVYEMVTGRPLFAGQSVSDTLAAVLKEEPEWNAVPGTVDRLLRLCLVKDARRRLRDIGDARALLEDAPPFVSALTPARRGMLLWAAGVLAAALLTISLLFWRAGRALEHPLIRVSVDLGPEVVIGTSSTVAISPDGRRLVFPYRGAYGKRVLATRLLDQAQPTILGGTENGSDPFFSPDGQWVGFFAEGKLKKISVNGGATVDLCAAGNPRGGSWGNDGNIVVALNMQGPLMRVAGAGGTPQAITKLLPGESTHRWPQVLPTGDDVIFTASPNAVGLEDASVEVLSLKTGQVRVLERGGYFGRVLPSGHLVYIHQGVLYGIGFDVDRLETRGTPMPLLEDVAANPITGGGELDFSAAPSGPGTLVYVAGKAPAQNWQLGWLDSTGNMKPLIATPGQYILPRFSPDGRKLVFIGGNGAPHIYDLDRETTTRLMSVVTARSASWAPDGKHIILVTEGALTWIRSDGAGGLQRLAESTNPLSAWSISPDGRWVAYFQSGPETGSDLWVLPLDTTDPDHPKTGAPQSFLRTPANEYLPMFSPDGRWIAYRSDESGNNEIWVMPFPAGTGARWQISAGGGLYALWSKNSRQLFYEAADQRIMVVDYRVNGDSFEPGKARVWADRQIFYPGVSNLDLAPDGRRFAVLTMPDSVNAAGSSVHVTMLFNYFDTLRRRIP